MYPLTLGEKKEMSLERLKFKTKVLGQGLNNMQLSGELTF